MRYIVPVLLASCLLLSGCYHAQMTTGKEASNTVVEEKWAPSFLYGLVPAEIDVSDQCTNGIASAERELSFLNMVVSTLTLNIFTPQSVTVTCAADGAMSSTDSTPSDLEFTVSANDTNEDVQELLNTAAVQSSISKKPLRIRVLTP